MKKDDLLKKWLTGRLSPEEAEAFGAMEEASFFEDIIADASAFKASQFSQAGDYKALKSRIHKQEASVRKVNWIRPVLRIASVLVLGAALYYFLWPNNLNTIRTEVGEQVMVNLPDESAVRVNARSQITYNSRNWAEDRKVKLQGEAFFDVVKGGRFRVITPEGEITVLGTEFNVKQRGRFFEVACYEGRVQVTSGSNKVVLAIGENFRSVNGVITRGNNNYTSPQWMQDISTFDRVALSEVFAELERQYGVVVSLENVDADTLFTGGFAHDNLENALKSITEPLNLEYHITETKHVRVKPGEN